MRVRRRRGRVDAARPRRGRVYGVGPRQRPHRRAAVRLLPARRRLRRRDDRAGAPRRRPGRLPGGASGRRRAGRAHQHVRRQRARARRAGRLRARRPGSGARRVRAWPARPCASPGDEVARRDAGRLGPGDRRPRRRGGVHEHHLERPTIVAVGGGAGGLGRAVAGALELDIVVPERAEVICAIGDALSLVRAERERTFNQPTPAELQALVAEVETEAILAGASASTLDVRVEQVVERGAVRVTVTGAVGLNSGAVPGRQPATRAEVSALAAARQYPDVAPLGQYWFATRLDRGGNVAVFDLYGDLVIDVAGETVDAGRATAEGIDAAIVRRTKRVGPVSIAPAVWVIGGARFLQVADTDPRPCSKRRRRSPTAAPTQRSSSGEPDPWPSTSPPLAAVAASSSSRSWRSCSVCSSARSWARHRAHRRRPARVRAQERATDRRGSARHRHP